MFIFKSITLHYHDFWANIGILELEVLSCPEQLSKSSCPSVGWFVGWLVLPPLWKYFFIRSIIFLTQPSWKQHLFRKEHGKGFQMKGVHGGKGHRVMIKKNHVFQSWQDNMTNLIWSYDQVHFVHPSFKSPCHALVFTLAQTIKNYCGFK